LARTIVLIPYLFRFADAINFRKDYSPPSSPPSRPFNLATCVFSATTTCFSDKWRFVGTQGSMLVQRSTQVLSGRGCSGWIGVMSAARRPCA
jgi:hypothetical protein